MNLSLFPSLIFLVRLLLPMISLLKSAATQMKNSLVRTTILFAIQTRQEAFLKIFGAPFKPKKSGTVLLRTGQKVAKPTLSEPISSQF